MDITSASFSIHASQLKENEALARKTVADFSNALSIAGICVQFTRDL